jgi:hypothetical protein
MQFKQFLQQWYCVRLQRIEYEGTRPEKASKKSKYII